MLRKFYRSALPATLRSKIRFGLRSLPFLIRDLPADLGSMAGEKLQVPGPFMRARVGLNSSRTEFLSTGIRLFESLDAAIRPVLAVDVREAEVFDFGCGCGRVAIPAIERWRPRSFSGYDPDTQAMRWCRRHLRGQFHDRPLLPPLPFPDKQFDIIYAVSVFTHLPGEAQRPWADELVRMLKPGGILAASSLSRRHTFERPELTPAQHDTLAAEGFLHVPGDGRFNAASSFHSFEKLATLFGPGCQVVSQTPHGLAGYQDLSVFKRIGR